MSINHPDPIEVARMVLEGKTNGPEQMDEGLRDALDTAIANEQAEFEYDGKTYNTSDLMQEAEDVTGKQGGVAVKAPHAAADNAKEMKKDKNKPSHASAKIDTPKESVVLDIDDVLAEMLNSDSEDMSALFNGEDLTEDFKSKAKTIFETAVRARVKDIAEKLEEEANNKLNESVNATRDELTESLDDYLSYVVSEWTKENQIALDRGIKTDVAESFMMGLKNLFEAHYIDVPDSKFDLVEELQGRVAELEGNLNEEIRSNVYLKKLVEGSQCHNVFNQITEGMVDTQVEKLQSLAENMEYSSPEDFGNQLSHLKEAYFSAKPSSDVTGEVELYEENNEEEIRYYTPEMRSYTSFMDRQAKYSE
jgi:hypothetical protein